MVFPELRGLFKRADDGRVLSLGLERKSADVTTGLGFGTTELEFLRHYPTIYAALAGSGPSWSGETVSRETALNHSVVWAAYRLICETMGVLPAPLKITAGSGKEDAVGHPMYSGMMNAPNEEISAQGFKELLTGNCMLDGDGFAKITRRSGTGTAIALDYITPAQVVINREKQGLKRLVYQILDQYGRTEGEYTLQAGKPHDIFHLRGLSPAGIRGYNVIRMGRQSIGTAIAAERNVGKFWANGGRVPYILEMVKKFASDEDFEKFRAQWEQTYGEPHKAPILENGTTYKQTGLSMVDSQALETRQWTVSELTRWWGVSPHLVGDLSRATFSNIEQLFLEFKTITVSRWAKRWEQDFWRCVLTPEEKDKRFFLKFNVDALLRGDFKTRMDGYAIAIQNGFKNVDEVRNLEDDNPLPNGAGQAYRFQLNMQTTPGTGAPTVTEQSILNRSKPSTSSDAQMKSIIAMLGSLRPETLAAMEQASR